MVHVASGIEFVFVPAGNSTLGARTADQIHFDRAEFLDDPNHADRIEAGEIELLRRATVASLPTLSTHVTEFLLARTPLTRRQVEALGWLKEGGSAPRISGAAPDEPYYFLPGEFEGLPLPTGLRLPEEHEWEHACRYGGSGPFRWGAEVPGEPIDPPHPLGLQRLGWHPERCAGPYRPSHDPDALPTSDHVARGGAAALYPWQLGSAEWTLLLPYRRTRLTKDPIDGQHAVRLAMNIPEVDQAREAPTLLEEDLVPTEPAEATRQLMADIGAEEPAIRDAALDEIVRMASPGIWSAQWAHLVHPLIGVLSRSSDADALRVSRALGALAVGDPATFSATGLDTRRSGWAASLASHGARSVRKKLQEEGQTLAALLAHSSPILRAHAAFLLPIAAPKAPIALESLETALAGETDERALLGEAVAYGLVARQLGQSPQPTLASNDGVVPRAARCLARLPSGYSPTSEELADLVELVRTVSVDEARFPWRWGRLDMLVAYHLHAHDPSPRAAGLFLARLTRAVGPTHPLVVSFIGGALALGFGGQRCASPEALGEEGRAIVEGLSHFDAGGERIASNFGAIGLPTTAEGRRAWLRS